MKQKDDTSRQVVNTTIRGLLGGIPYVGHLLNEVVFEHWTRVKQERVNKFVLEFAKYIEDNYKASQIINPDRIKTEEFGDLLESVLVGVSKSSSEFKLKVFRNILTKRLFSANSSADLERLYVDITNSISEIQFFILSIYASIKEEELYIPVRIEIDKSGVRKFTNIPGFTRSDWQKESSSLYKKWRNMDNPNDSKTYSIDDELFQINVIDMISKGLLFDYHTENTVIERNKYFCITSKGRKYIEYVKNWSVYNRTN